MKEQMVIGVLNASRNVARAEDPFEHGFDIDRMRRDLADFVDNDRQVGRRVLGDTETLPMEPENGGRDGSSRNARDAIELAQIPGLIQTQQGSDVEQHGAVTAPGKTESDPNFQGWR